MINILIVEDEIAISNLMTMSLKRTGYNCTCVYNGADAADMLEKRRFDLVLLDVMLPGVDGFTLMEFIRPKNIPVIFITAKNSLDDRVRGLRMGAEDYIVKPFEVLELIARVDVVLRRFNKTEILIRTGGIEIDTEAMRVTKNGEEICLTPKEYEILLLFVHNPGVALYREIIYERVWNEDFPFGSKTVDLHIQRLRKKIGWENKIRSVNKVGYRLEV